MNEPEVIGYIGRDRRKLYFVLETDNEAYIVHEPDFRQFLTQRAIKGFKASDLENLTNVKSGTTDTDENPEEAEGLK